MRHREWIPVLLGMLPVLAGCQGETAVTVAGAVERPGDYAFQPKWRVQEYVAASGGYLPEADVAEAHLVRALPDSAIEGDDDYLRISRWPLDQAPEVIPGDQIVVPLKTYAVSLDTVRSVKDVLIEWNGRVYRVAQGSVAPGWTERGVTSAVVIGDGAVTRKDGGDLLGRFHYLYLRMHPGEYARVLPDVGDLISDREVLEDAAEVHRNLFEKSAYRAGIETEMPPEGYLRVQAGMWPAPKSRSFPGPGMRKRRYPDGREWTTFSDGRQRMKYPDGKVVVEFPDSTQETRHADGRLVFRDMSGNVQTHLPDGRQVWEMASGNELTVYADGRRVHRDTSGDVRTVLPDGMERTVFPDGTRHARYPDGRVVMTASTGKTETRYPDGRILVVTAEGHEVTAFPDGRQFTRMADGTTVEAFSDGRRVQQTPSGETLEILPDGERRTVYADGSEVVRRPDGSRVVRLPAGTLVEIFPDGRQVQVDAKGNRVEVYPDGRQVQTDLLGNRFERLPDGRLRKTFADPYGYRGPVREDLVAMEQIPDPLSPGVEVFLSGAVSDSVRGIYVHLFRIPDGDVITIPVKVRDGRFQGGLKVKDSGHYRLQTSASLSETWVEATVDHQQPNAGGPAPRAVPTGIAVVDDRLLKVGDPPPLVAPTLEIPPFPGPEASARRLIELVNRARQQLGRGPLIETVWLTKVARAHLQEMLAMGYFSGQSPVTGTVYDRLMKQRVPFREANQILSHAPSLEEAHDQLMSSAGHRKNILDVQWTHLGVAVEAERGQVWVVEVFVRE